MVEGSGEGVVDDAGGGLCGCVSFWCFAFVCFVRKRMEEERDRGERGGMMKQVRGNGHGTGPRERVKEGEIKGREAWENRAKIRVNQ